MGMENQNTAALLVRISPDLKHSLRVRAAEEDMSAAAYIRRLIRQDLAKSRSTKVKPT